MAASLGAVVGVVAGVAGTLLSDKKNRQVLEKKAGELVKEGRVLAKRAGKEVASVTRKLKKSVGRSK
ncbi:MAG: hypothetical protein AAB909_00305 [Patescibacteria group bacterium]